MQLSGNAGAEPAQAAGQQPAAPADAVGSMRPPPVPPIYNRHSQREARETLSSRTSSTAHA